MGNNHFFFNAAQKTVANIANKRFLRAGIAYHVILRTRQSQPQIPLPAASSAHLSVIIRQGEGRLGLLPA